MSTFYSPYIPLMTTGTLNDKIPTKELQMLCDIVNARLAEERYITMYDTIFNKNGDAMDRCHFQHLVDTYIMDSYNERR